MQTILGANGTIGQVLARELVPYTSQIRLVSRNPRKVNATDELFPADLFSQGAVEKAVAGSEVVYLLVGMEYNLKVWQQRWPRLMEDTVDACARHGAKLVFFDNMYLYDKDALGYMTENSPVKPPSKKGEVRMRVAQTLMDAVESKKLDALIARSADFYGPGNEKSFLIETVYKNLAKGSSPNWFSNADVIHSFTYTPDAAKATAILGNTSDAYNQVWHVPTSSEKLTGREMASLFMEEMHVQKKMVVLPKWMIRLIGLFMPFMREMPEMLYQYEKDYFFDSSRFNTRFHFTPTSYRDGVRETIRSFSQS